MTTYTIEGRTFEVVETLAVGEGIQNANPNIIAMVLLKGKRNAHRYAYLNIDGSIDVIGSI